MVAAMPAAPTKVVDNPIRYNPALWSKFFVVAPFSALGIRHRGEESTTAHGGVQHYVFECYMPPQAGEDGHMTMSDMPQALLDPWLDPCTKFTRDTGYTRFFSTTADRLDSARAWLLHHGWNEKSHRYPSL